MDWTREKVHEIVEKQRNYFLTNETLSISWRKEQLKKLKEMLLSNTSLIENALYEDLGRHKTEAFFCDIAPIISEINDSLRNLNKWAKTENHFSGIINFPSSTTKVYKMPYGVTLIISPFNFPFTLSLSVLVAAISGGNTAVIKCSSKSVASTKLLQELISKTFDEKYCTIIDGGHDVADFCLEERFDKIFYTGSPKVAKHVMECAAKNLTPVALELGGETGNWCIVREDADLQDAARKIAFFKICNSGQICININQVAVEESVADKFIDLLKKEFIRQIGNDPINNPEYAKLISKGAFKACEDEAKKYKDKIIFGGEGNIDTQKFSPTIIYPVSIDDEIVNHELFCPLLPIVKFKKEEIINLINTINKREHGLAFYIFTKNIKWAKQMMKSCQFGGGCINEVCLHFMSKDTPFNGVGHSGMGSYHGEWGFREFTHPQTVLIGKTKFNLSLREHPFKDNPKKYKLIKKLFK